MGSSVSGGIPTGPAAPQKGPWYGCSSETTPRLARPLLLRMQR